jgi:hypothetical protein
LVDFSSYGAYRGGGWRHTGLGCVCAQAVGGCGGPKGGSFFFGCQFGLQSGGFSFCSQEC